MNNTATKSNQVTQDIMFLFKNFRTCGLKQIVQHSDDKVVFHFKGGMQKKISMVTFEIDHGTDTYNVSFGKIFKYEYKEIKSYDLCYMDQLVDLFEQLTGYCVY